jgi:Ala-tRNA(Pro) deacylase
MAGHLPSEVTGRCLMSLVTEYLDARGVPYEVIHHDPSRTSLEEARAVHLDADHVLKAVVIATRGGRAVAVIPASRRLDLHLVREALADRSAYLATEDQLECEYPSIELGGAPVLGCLLDAETLVDPCVLERDTVVFAAGTRTESVRVQMRDLFRGEHAAFVRLVAESESAEMSEA